MGVPIDTFIRVISGVALLAGAVAVILGESNLVAGGCAVAAAIVVGGIWLLIRRPEHLDGREIRGFDILPVHDSQFARFPVSKPPARVFSAAMRALEEIPPRTVEIDWENRRCTALTGYGLSGYGEAIHISVEDDGNGGSVIDIQSGPPGPARPSSAGRDRANVYRIGVAVRDIGTRAPNDEPE